MTLSKHNRRAYLTATLAILPVLVLLAACQSSPQPTASVVVTPTRTATVSTRAATRSHPGAHTHTAAGDCQPPAREAGALPPPLPTHRPRPQRPVWEPNWSICAVSRLQFWYIAQAGDAVGLLPALVSEFNKSNTWGLRVEIVAFDSPGLLSERVRNTLYSGKLPDVLAGYSYQVTSWDKNAKTLVDLNPYLEDFVWGLSVEDQADFYSAFWQQASPGKRLGIPLHRNALGLYYNLTWAKELGYSKPPQNIARI